VVVAARNAAAAADVLALLARHNVRAAHVPLERWAEDTRPLVISTLALAGSSAAGDALDVSGSSFAGSTLLDVVYADWPTPLARTARDHGAEIVSGLDMLVYQAAAQIELMTGRPGPVGAMFAAVLEADSS
ncbi:MAG: shikimate dehydrogenase, partial [Knoellia sp.]